MYFYITVLIAAMYQCQGWVIFFAIDRKRIEVTLKLGLFNVPVCESLALFEPIATILRGGHPERSKIILHKFLFFAGACSSSAK